MNINMIDKIKQTSREEWEQIARERWTDLRIWIQENGELSLAVGFAAGLLAAHAFKVIIVIAAILALAALVIWLMALPEKPSHSETRESERTIAENGVNNSVDSSDD